MPFKETDQGWVRDEEDTRKGFPLFDPIYIVKRLFDMCWSIAHFATYLGKSQDEVRELLKGK